MKLVSEVLAAKRSFGGTVEGLGSYGTGLSTGEAVGSKLNSMVSNLLGLITILAGLFFVLQFALGAMKWIQASGDQQKVQAAQKQLTNAALGLIIVVVAYFLIGILGVVLGFDILNPGEVLQGLTP